MDKEKLEQFGNVVVEAVKAYCEREIPARVKAEVDAFKASQPAPKDGNDGINGKNGSSFVTGEGPPLFAGSPGDAYLDSLTGDLYKFA